MLKKGLGIFIILLLLLLLLLLLSVYRLLLFTVFINHLKITKKLLKNCFSYFKYNVFWHIFPGTIIIFFKTFSVTFFLVYIKVWLDRGIKIIKIKIVKQKALGTIG